MASASNNLVIEGQVLTPAGEVLPGATLELLNANGGRMSPPVGTITNEKGNFQIKATKGQVLEASFVGFDKSRVVLNNDSPKKFILNQLPGEGPEVPIKATKTNILLFTGLAIVALLYFSSE